MPIHSIFSKSRDAPSRSPYGTGARPCPYPKLLRRYDPRRKNSRDQGQVDPLSGRRSGATWQGWYSATVYTDLSTLSKPAAEVRLLLEVELLFLFWQKEEGMIWRSSPPSTMKSDLYYFFVWTLMVLGRTSSTLGNVRVRMPCSKTASALSACTGTGKAIERENVPCRRSRR